MSTSSSSPQHAGRSVRKEVAVRGETNGGDAGDDAPPVGAREAEEVPDRFAEAASRGLNAGLHRVLSVVVATASLALFGPLALVIAVAIKLDSRGPILYRQVRIGRNRRRLANDPTGGRRTANLLGRPFVIYKFRTMRHRIEQESGPKWAESGDQRTTRVGRLLRRFSLDEIPQLWNVLKGDMNLVGPRPERPGFVNSLRRRIPGYPLRHRVRPGITGLAQLHRGGDRTLGDVRKKVERDLEYIRNRSLWLDLKILAYTPLAMLRADGAESVVEGSPAEGEGRTDERPGAERDEEGTEDAGSEGFDSLGIGRPERRTSAARPGAGSSAATTILVASEREELGASLEEILDSSVVRVVRAVAEDRAARLATLKRPGLVMVDMDLDGDPVALVAHLAKQRLSPDVPILLYSERKLEGTDLHARALEAGAWTVVDESVRSDAFRALLGRLLRVHARVTEATAEEHLVDPDTSLFTLAGLRRVLARLGALAAREKAPLSFLVVAPTVAPARMDREMALMTAELCSTHVRKADVCAWLKRGELAIVAYDTPAEGACQLVDRLNTVARRTELPLPGDGPLSAGIVELKPHVGLTKIVGQGDEREFPDHLSQEEFRELYSLAEARNALRAARRNGGGAKVADVA